MALPLAGTTDHPSWAAEIAGDREYLEQYFDYEDVGNGVTVMTLKVEPQDSAEEGDES